MIDPTRRTSRERLARGDAVLDSVKARGTARNTGGGVQTRTVSDKELPLSHGMLNPNFVHELIPTAGYRPSSVPHKPTTLGGGKS